MRKKTKEGSPLLPADPNVNTLFGATRQRAREKVKRTRSCFASTFLKKHTSSIILGARLLPEVLAFILVFSSRGSENETLRPYRFWQLQIQSEHTVSRRQTTCEREGKTRPFLLCERVPSKTHILYSFRRATSARGACVFILVFSS